MKGIWIYFVPLVIIAILSAFVHLFFITIIIPYLLYLFKRKKFSAKQIFFFLILFTIFFIRSDLAEKQNKSKIDNEHSAFHIVFQDVKVDGDLLTANVKELSTEEKLILRYQINSEDEKNFLAQSLKPKISCKVKGKLKEPSNATNPNGFDYQAYLNRKQTYWILQIEQFSLTACISQKATITSFFRTLRHDGVLYLKNHFPEETAPLAAALLFGEDELMDANIFEAYQSLGIVHLLAISGGHVAMVVGMLFYIGIRVGVTREKMVTFLILFLPCYAMLTGASPSVIRAVFMLLFVLIAQKLKAALLIQDVICIVLIAYILFQPYIIFDIGFQLSFAVSFALILSASLLLKRFTNPLVFLMATSFICQISAAPILFWYFYEISIISILANIPFVPLFTFILVPVISALFLLHLVIGEKIQWAITLLNAFIHQMDRTAEKMADIPFAVLTLGRPPLIVLLLYIFTVFLFFTLWERRTGLKNFVRLFLLPLSLLFIHFFVNILVPEGEIIFIDVGQGDSILIKMPYGQGNILIDTGGTVSFGQEEWAVRKEPFEVGKDTVIPLLKSKGIQKIDKLIITHGDTDHSGGASAIMDAIKVEEIILPVVEVFSEQEKELITMAKNKKIPVHFTKAGDHWLTGDAKFYVLSPQSGKAENKNDGSIVIYTEIGGLKWLFTGDLEGNGEKLLMKQYPKLKIDALKVGHHGSKSSTSDAFLTSLAPKIAIISSGRNNRYGHPNGEVLERLEERKIDIYRTDLSGAVTFHFKKEQGTISVELP